MFCPRCGIDNPDTGKFCRSCGTDLGDVSEVLAGKLSIEKGCATDRRGKPITIESAVTKFFMGVGFIAVAIGLAFSGRGGGWWFYMFIPAFLFIGSGIAQYLQIRRFEQARVGFSAEAARSFAPVPQSVALPPQNTNFIHIPESQYKTGDRVPPSVTDTTTKHLEIDTESETITLPKI
jgi:hypothetical protein